ncbi:MAG: DNA polymerase IV, partial [Bowdeniella nasicola]|nr:DNA polymerase IV [Bowdeniella nasicola]
PGRRDLYRAASGKIMEELHRICAVVEQVSIDEAFLDVSGAIRQVGSPVDIAALIRHRIATRVGVPASVGIATRTHVAKLASTFAKPNGMLLVASDHTIAFLHSLPIAALPGVGPRAQAVLEKHGIVMARDLLAVTHQRLSRWLGANHALRLRQLVEGRELRGIQPHRQEKSVSKERTFQGNLTSRTQLATELIDQAHALARRLRSLGLVGGGVAIKVRFADFRTLTRSRALSHPTDVGAVIAATAKDLLAEVHIPAAGVRLIGCRVEGLHERAQGVQLAIGEKTNVRKAEAVADAIAQRFGPKTIRPARLISPDSCQ